MREGVQGSMGRGTCTILGSGGGGGMGREGVWGGKGRGGFVHVFEVSHASVMRQSCVSHASVICGEKGTFWGAAGCEEGAGGQGLG